MVPTHNGAACLFSHNVPPANGSYPASAVKLKTVKNLTLRSSANSATQLNKHGSTSQQTLNMSKIMSPKTPVSLETITKQPVPNIAQAPIGINFLNFGNVQFSDIRKQPNGESLPLVGGNATSICSEKRSVSEKFPNSNETLGRMSSSTAPMCQSSTMITEGNDLCNSALKALVSTFQLAEYECKTTDQSVQSTASNVIIPTVSSIMQELLFCGRVQPIAFGVDLDYRSYVRPVPFYAAAQVTGATVASFTLQQLLQPIERVGTTSPYGSDIQALVMEIVVTFSMMFITSAVSTDTKAIGELAGIAVGSAVCITSILAGPISGGSMNPARSIGPAIASKYYEGIWVYALGPVVGTLMGAWSYNLIRVSDGPVHAISPQSFSFKIHRLQSGEGNIADKDHLDI
ncbi:hypothetical protein IFM89_031313 [Coptis chinensis]|uniref:Uncharacterized protein n=1 Tax=Coptis chinensis TaxID=261450 RepID=A0A835MJQ4_9MAGN|nr:hypothetical protein IFM89_031313 [Coptis chinensis]